MRRNIRWGRRERKSRSWRQASDVDRLERELEKKALRVYNNGVQFAQSIDYDVYEINRFEQTVRSLTQGIEEGLRGKFSKPLGELVRINAELEHLVRPKEVPEVKESATKIGSSVIHNTVQEITRRFLQDNGIRGTLIGMSYAGGDQEDYGDRSVSWNEYDVFIRMSVSRRFTEYYFDQAVQQVIPDLSRGLTSNYYLLQAFSSVVMIPLGTVWAVLAGAYSAEGDLQDPVTKKIYSQLDPAVFVFRNRRDYREYETEVDEISGVDNVEILKVRGQKGEASWIVHYDLTASKTLYDDGV